MALENVGDWRPYDVIADRYDEVWGPRFEAVAGHLWALIGVQSAGRVLDIGTGTGLVPRALGARASELRCLVGCDRSSRMLARARTAMPNLRVVTGDAADLPFGTGMFDAATASFVLSHVLDYRRGLAEVLRVLKPSGVFGGASWAANTDPYSQAWAQLLADAVSERAVRAAEGQIAPHEAFFGDASNFETALAEAGFTAVAVHTVELDCAFSLELYLRDRELGSGGRFARQALGSDGWSRFLASAREKLQSQFGSQFSYTRGVLIGVGRRR
ncbi:MAG: methyltransferase domain-containing protein [Novosphingobium sp.]|nr:methyltransferase domain-containing protein [Novosphingobium sp.]